MWFWQKQVPDARRVDSSSAQALVAAGATLVDVRTVAEFRTGSLPGAVNIPLNRLARRLDDLDRGQPVVVFCRSGARSAQAMSILAAAEFEAHDLGAISTWRSKSHDGGQQLAAG